MITEEQAEEMLIMLGGLVTASIALYNEGECPMEIIENATPMVAKDICRVLGITKIK